MGFMQIFKNDERVKNNYKKAEDAGCVLRLKYRDQNSALPTVLGWSSTSRMLEMPVRYMTMRSKPRP